ncbi:MAG: metallophosphoesterase [Muribaculaceae bacterium]|nr:metallophosphoesterase [Muribaculaceae bacterium]
MKAKHIIFVATLAAMAITQTSCEKVSPQGVLMAGTAVEDRVEMSYLYYQNNNFEYKLDDDIILSSIDKSSYSFLVGADSHITTDVGRMNEMFQIGFDNNDLLFCHLGDIADTKPEYYINLENCLRENKLKYVSKYYDYDEATNKYHRKGGESTLERNFQDIRLPFFPVVGNHDLTHNGWALWSNIFGSSFYQFDVPVGYDEDDVIFDHFIFLDTASGTLGKKQVDLIEQGVLDGKGHYRHTFIFSHTNIFRPSSMQFASTFPREETFFLLKQFDKWNASIVFCGHVHAYEERAYNGVYFITLDSMSERNSPKPGDYLVRVKVDEEGYIDIENVHMNYVAK